MAGGGGRGRAAARRETRHGGDPRRRAPGPRERVQDHLGGADPRLRPGRGERAETMKFDTPATTNPIDRLRVVGKPLDRIDGPLKTTGTAPYAYERHDIAPDAAYGFVLGSAVAK